MRSHRESISLIKGETGTGTPVARADTRARIQRRRKFMPVPYRRRGRLTTFHLRYRHVYLPISLRLPFSLPTLPSSRSLARTPIIPPYLRTESRFLRVTQPSTARPLIIFPRAAVPEFLNGGWMKPVPPPDRSSLRRPASHPLCERLSASVELDRRRSNSSHRSRNSSLFYISFSFYQLLVTLHNLVNLCSNRFFN